MSVSMLEASARPHLLMDSSANLGVGRLLSPSPTLDPGLFTSLSRALVRIRKRYPFSSVEDTALHQPHSW